MSEVDVTYMYARPTETHGKERQESFENLIYIFILLKVLNYLIKKIVFNLLFFLIIVIKKKDHTCGKVDHIKCLSF